MAKRRRPRALILGLPYFGTMMSRALEGRGWDARYLDHPGRSARGWGRVAGELARADLLYLVSARVERGAPLDRLMRAWRKPVVIDWVGTDVLIAREEFDRGRLSARVAKRAVHWADAPWLVDELAEMGMRAEMVRLPVAALAAVAPPLPERFTALLYLPVDSFDREVFDVETILRLPGAFPDIRFVLIPSPPETLPGDLPPNLEARAWVDDMDALYREVTVLVRLLTHDGMPFTALEVMSRGRYVIYPYELPGVIRAEGFEAVAAALAGLKARHDAGELGLNVEGMAWVRESYDTDEIVDEIDRRLRALL